MSGTGGARWVAEHVFSLGACSTPRELIGVCFCTLASAVLSDVRTVRAGHATMRVKGAAKNAFPHSSPSRVCYYSFPTSWLSIPVPLQSRHVRFSESIPVPLQVQHAYDDSIGHLFFSCGSGFP